MRRSASTREMVRTVEELAKVNDVLRVDLLVDVGLGSEEGGPLGEGTPARAVLRRTPLPPPQNRAARVPAEKW